MGLLTGEEEASSHACGYESSRSWHPLGRVVGWGVPGERLTDVGGLGRGVAKKDGPGLGQHQMGTLEGQALWEVCVV
jgi:hypothetical protein